MLKKRREIVSKEKKKTESAVKTERGTGDEKRALGRKEREQKKRIGEG